MAERQMNEAVADALRKWALDRRNGHGQYPVDESLTDLLDKAADRLRSMPEGEMIEVVAYERDHRDSNCSCAKARTWTVEKQCGHQPNNRPAILIIHNGEDKSDNG